MNQLTFTLAQATLLVTVAFLAGVGAAAICYSIIRAALVESLTEPLAHWLAHSVATTTAEPQAEPEPVFAPVPARLRAPAKTLARTRFIAPLPAVVLSPAEWARRSFDDPSKVRLAVQIGAGT